MASNSNMQMVTLDTDSIPSPLDVWKEILQLLEEETKDSFKDGHRNRELRRSIVQKVNDVYGQLYHVRHVGCNDPILYTVIRYGLHETESETENSPSEEEGEGFARDSHQSQNEKLRDVVILCVEKLVNLGDQTVILESFSKDVHKNAEDLDGTSAFDLAIGFPPANSLVPLFSRVCGKKYISQPKISALSRIFGYEHRMLPLAVCARACDVSAVKKLVECGVDLQAEDRNGNILHNLIYQYLSQPEKAYNIFQYIINEGAESWVEVRKETESTHMDRIKALSGLLKARNADGLSPLALCAKFDIAPIMELIVNVEGIYRYTQMRFSDGPLVLYDLSDIDHVVASHPIPETCLEEGQYFKTMEKVAAPSKTLNSTLDILLHNPDDNLNCLQTKLIKTILNRKVSNYLWLYILWGIFHMGLMILVTVSVSLRPLSANSVNQTHQLQEFTKHGFNGYFRLAVELALLLYALILLVVEIYDVFWYSNLSFVLYRFFCLLPFLRCWRRSKSELPPLRAHQTRSLLLLSRLRVHIVVFIVFVALLWILRLPSKLSKPLQDNREVCYGMVLFLGWSMSLYFNGAHYFALTFFKMIVDAVKFILMFLVILLGLATAMFLIFQRSPDKPAEFATMQMTMFTLYRLMFGLVEVESFDKATVPGFAYFLYIVFIAITMILLLNMLIAIMNDTQRQIADRKISMWRKQIGIRMMMLERRLPARWQPMGHYRVFLNKWCLPVNLFHYKTYKQGSKKFIADMFVPPNVPLMKKFYGKSETNL